MITKLLVANRGEIARRVFATCRRLGIETVAVHSDADADLPFVAEADHAVRLPGDTPAETYLRADLVVDAARRAGADAIHPGYGFLSENAPFARAVRDAGLTWVGPSPEAIEAMGSKVRAKEIMREAGVPVLPSWTGADLGGGRVADPRDEDRRIETPLLVKASAGGGGRGMRIVRSLDTLDAEVAAAQSEAASAFGDGTVFVEPYVERGRHVEVQVVGHADGVLVLGDRDCSVQRRHQKVVEEAPAPGLPAEVRTALHEAAEAATRAIDYRGAGTVEFLYDPTGERFYFLEMNTRLQVEHPVTECVHGLDLVELQLAVAEGYPLGDEVPQPCEPHGHAVEVRLYAEDPATGYTPQSGRLVTLEVPDAESEFGPAGAVGLRVDAGYVSGSEVSTHYDAMLAKLIAWAPTREQAVRRLAGALRRTRIHGLTTNRDQLLAVLRHPDFVAGDLATDFLERMVAQPPPGGESRPDTPLGGGPATESETRNVAQPPPGEAPGPDLTAVAAALMLAEDDAARRTVQRGIPTGWRNVVSQPQRAVLAGPDGEVTVEWVGTRAGYAVDGITVLAASPRGVRLEVDGVAASYDGLIRRPEPGAPREVHVDGPDRSVGWREVPRFTDPADQLASGSLLAHMPGTVVKVLVDQGERVAAGAAVLVLEAMKMQHTVTAPTDGTVTEISVEPGAQVAAGDVLAVVEEVVAEEEQG